MGVGALQSATGLRSLLCSVQSWWWESLSCHQVWINVDSPLKNSQQCSSHTSGGRAGKWVESFLYKSCLLPRCSHKIGSGLVLQRVSTCQPVKWHVISGPCPAWWGNLFTGLFYRGYPWESPGVVSVKESHILSACRIRFITLSQTGKSTRATGRADWKGFTDKWCNGSYSAPAGPYCNRFLGV